MNFSVIISDLLEDYPVMKIPMAKKHLQQLTTPTAKKPASVTHPQYVAYVCPVCGANLGPTGRYQKHCLKCKASFKEPKRIVFASDIDPKELPKHLEWPGKQDYSVGPSGKLIKFGKKNESNENVRAEGAIQPQFDLSTTGRSDWDKGIAEQQDRFEVEVEWMSPQQFLKIARFDRYQTDPNKVKQFEKSITNESILPTPCLWFTTTKAFFQKRKLASQFHDGQHRVMALQNLGVTKIPVLQIFEKESEEAIAIGLEKVYGKHEAIEKMIDEVLENSILSKVNKIKNAKNISQRVAIAELVKQQELVFVLKELIKTVPEGNYTLAQLIDELESLYPGAGRLMFGTEVRAAVLALAETEPNVLRANFTLGLDNIVILSQVQETKNPDIKKGDTILTGKWKNSPAVVKGFGKDAHNQPTVRTSKGEISLYKFRIKKLMDSLLEV